jgi:hypothetical protein
LLAATALTFGLSHVPLGRAEVAVALGIGGAKALVVAAVFMELATARFTHRAALGFAALLTLTLVAFATADVLTRP